MVYLFPFTACIISSASTSQSTWYVHCMTHSWNSDFRILAHSELSLGAYYLDIIFYYHCHLPSPLWRGRAGRTPILGSTQELVKDCGHRCINGRPIVRRKIERKDKEVKCGIACMCDSVVYCCLSNCLSCLSIYGLSSRPLYPSSPPTRLYAA